MPSTSLFEDGPIAGKSVSHGPTFAGEQRISSRGFCLLYVPNRCFGTTLFNC